MDRRHELRQYERIRFPVPISEADMRIAYEKGMLPKGQLRDGKYYLGFCRNASVAQWVEKEHAFYYMRTKFNHIYPEKIFHPEDDNEMDLFIPYKQVEPHQDENIREGRQIL